MLLLPIGVVGRIPNRSSSIIKFCTCSVLQGSNMGMKLNKIMNKFLGESKSRKKKFHVIPIGGTPEFLDYVANYKSAGKTDRRMTVLNKLFMQNITDILATGELCPEICGKGIQISKVKVTSGYNQVNVYWLANGTEEDSVTENLLSKLGPDLRHSLSQLRIMGSVPKIEFIKDSSYFKYMQVENILRTADMGENFEPTSLASDWKSVLPHHATPPPPSKVPNKEGSESETESKEVHDEELPCMRMDIFGLNHDIIMKRVTQAMDKAKAAHRRDPSRKISNNITDSFEATDVINAKERQKLFQEYLLKKKLELKKQFKKERRYRPEMAINEQDAAIKLANEFKEYYDENYSEDFERSDDHIEYDDRPNKNI